MKSQDLPIQYADEPPESEAKWQKHVMVALWISLALMIALSIALVLAEGHGLFHSAPNGPLPTSPDLF
jgi:hypothetical protein